MLSNSAQNGRVFSHCRGAGPRRRNKTLGRINTNFDAIERKMGVAGGSSCSRYCHRHNMTDVPTNSEETPGRPSLWREAAGAGRRGQKYRTWALRRASPDLAGLRCVLRGTWADLAWQGGAAAVIHANPRITGRTRAKWRQISPTGSDEERDDGSTLPPVRPPNFARPPPGPARTA